MLITIFLIITKMISKTIIVWATSWVYAIIIVIILRFIGSISWCFHILAFYKHSFPLVECLITCFSIPINILWILRRHHRSIASTNGKGRRDLVMPFLIFVILYFAALLMCSEITLNHWRNGATFESRWNAVTINWWCAKHAFPDCHWVEWKIFLTIIDFVYHIPGWQTFPGASTVPGVNWALWPIPLNMSNFTWVVA